MLTRSLALVLVISGASLVQGFTEPRTIPKGYKFLDYVEFTDNPNNGLPHMHLDERAHNASQPPEGWHTLLITPDGKSYIKPLADSLQELDSPSAQTVFPPSQDVSEQLWANRVARKLAQSSTTIGVSTSNDLSCNGCGPDNRIQVTQTTTYPYMTMGQLIGQLGTSTVGLECTGTLIGNKHVVTAAHCVFDINASRKMVASLNFAPARNGNSAPYGTINWSQARIVTQFSSQPSYTTTAMNYDFALVTLENDATSGFLGLYLPPSSGTLTANLNTAGYPGSKPSGTLWSSACGNTKIDYSSNNEFADVQQCSGDACSNIMTHTCISSDGQSGSGMWDTNYDIRAILTGRVTTSNGDAYNVGTEISTEVYNQLASWYNEDGDSAGNGTLPLAPSGPGSQPKKQNSFIQFWTQNWGKGWFIGVVIVIAIVAAGLLFLLFTCLLRCCCSRSATPVKQQPAPARTYGAQYPPYAQSGAFPSRASEGAQYNPQSNQFIVNGRPYGAYVGHSPRAYSPRQAVSPSAPPYR